MISNLILVIVSGVLTGLAFNSPDFSFLIWFSLIPFLYVVSKSLIKKSFFYGIIFGFIFHLISIFWLTNVTGLGFIVLILYLSLYYGLFAVSAKYCLSKHFKLISISCLWILMEFLKENIWSGFGWTNLAYSQYSNFYLVQISDIFGAKGISFLIILVNILMWEVLLRFKRSGSKRVNKITKSDVKIIAKILAVTLVFLICFYYALNRLGQIGAFKSKTNILKIGIAQPNISQDAKWDPKAAPEIITRLKIVGDQTEKDSLLIFPEAAWPHTIGENDFRQIKEFVIDLNRDVLIGAVTEIEGKFYNTALLFNKKAELVESYKKIKLVPFGEYVPLRWAFGAIPVVNEIGDMTPGKDIIRFSYKNKKSFSVLICFEDTSPLHVARFARDNDFLVNMTNDAWFGGEPEASQHLGVMLFRAIENRIPIIRSANTGISGWVSAKGEIENIIPQGHNVFVLGANTFEIFFDRKITFYNKYREALSLACLIILVAILLSDKMRKVVLKRNWESD